MVVDLEPPHTAGDTPPSHMVVGLALPHRVVDTRPFHIWLLEVVAVAVGMDSQILAALDMLLDIALPDDMERHHDGMRLLPQRQDGEDAAQY
jgi:hypothetical protein